MTKVQLNENIFLIMNFWSKEQCENFIQMSEEKGYSAAKIDTGMGNRVVSSVRNNKRVMHKDQYLADELWNQLAEHIPERYGNFKASGLNELFRFYRYQPNEEFKKHTDQSYVRNENEISFYTFMIYLNNNFSGGETLFTRNKITPVQGMALVFLHSLDHAGSPISSGTKYVLRTDVMYQKMANQ